MKFMRLIKQGPQHAYFNMALDEAVSEAVRRRLSPPTLRLYGWDRPSLSLGRFQAVSDIDKNYCDEKGYPVVRRQTGGRAVLHDAELTYSFSARSDDTLFSGSLIENYTLISDALLLGLRISGVTAKASYIKKRASAHNNPACFRAVSFGEITVEGKKVIGSAQKRYKDGFLQHGSILLRFSRRELANVLGQHDEDSFSDIGAINDYAPDISFNTLCSTLKEAFGKSLKIKLINDKPSRYEQDRAAELERTRYSNPEWNYSR